MGLDKNIINCPNSNHMIVRFLLWLHEVITFICIALIWFFFLATHIATGIRLMQRGISFLWFPKISSECDF